MELRAQFPTVRRQQKIFMSSASELFAQSSSLHRQAARGRALRDPVSAGPLCGGRNCQIVPTEIPQLPVKLVTRAPSPIGRV
jgi:hypothetical protein